MACLIAAWIVGLVSLQIAGSPSVPQERWSLPDSRLGVRTAPILLLTRDDVRQDLGLTSSQAHSMQRVVDDLRARAAALKGKPDVDAIAERRTIDDAQNEWIGSQLDDRQRERLLQLDLQWEGPTAVITRPWVAEFLALSSEQRSRFAAAIAKQRAQAAGSELGIETHKALAAGMLEALTPNQRQQWERLLGKPLELHAESRNSGDRGLERR